MAEDKLIDKINAAKHFILWAELAGLLHDIGKLSNTFYDYRRNWRSRENGWNSDPHDHRFLEESDNLIKQTQFKDLRGCFNRSLSELYPDIRNIFPDATKCSIATFVEKHTDPEDSLTRLLQAADGKDTALDRNNPLFTADQTGGTIYDTDVFGAEYGREFNPQKVDPKKGDDSNTVDDKRRELYTELQNLLPDYLKTYTCEKRHDILEAIKSKFSTVFSDTTRPDNDTSLWEHCYAVASLLKALIIHKIIYGETLDDFSKVRFGILGLGWDSLAFLSQGERIGDIVGRVIILEQLKDDIKYIIEYEYALGDTIYEDDNGVYFLVPRMPEEVSFEKAYLDKKNAYQQLLQEMKSCIDALALEISQGDLQPQFYMVPDTKFMTQVTKCIERLKDKTVSPLIGINDSIQKKLEEPWSGQDSKDVCPVCLRRPVVEEKPERRGICQECNDRRVRFYKEAHSKEVFQEDLIRKLEDKEKKEGTPFISGIVQANEGGQPRRAVLIVAKFDLRQWLNGRMIRSLFVTEARGLEKEVADLGHTRCFRKDEEEARDWLEHSPYGNLIRQGYDYRRLENEVHLIHNFGNIPDEDEQEYANKTVFLYDRRIVYDKGKKENILNRRPESVEEPWNEWLKDTLEEYELKVEDPLSLLPNILCAKTPTPSSILDVWGTTQKFFEELVREREEKILGIPKAIRCRATIPRPTGHPFHVRTAYEGRIVTAREGTLRERAVEIVWLFEKDNTALIVGSDYKEATEENWQEARVIIDGKPFGRADFPSVSIQDLETYEYRPMRIITTSPDLLMVIVPADQALRVTQQIYSEYLKQFGKVMGRLPLSIGNIFFEEHTPMFVILDCARRMLRNFETLGQLPVKIRVSKDHCLKTESSDSEERVIIKLDEIHWPGCPPVERSFEWQLPYQLGNKDIDFYHPYFVVQKESERDCGYSFRKNYFQTVVGDVIHFSEVQPGDILQVYPNYYDFEFLDATTRRYDLNLDIRKRRKSNVGTFFSKPYLLDDLGPQLPEGKSEEKNIGTKVYQRGRTGLGLQTLWDKLKDKKKEGDKALMPGLTDTQLRNIESLWLAKLREWEVDLEKPGSESYKRWAELVETTLRREFPAKFGDLTREPNREDFEFLKEAIFSGLFFDCLELHLRILKERIEEKMEGG